MRSIFTSCSLCLCGKKNFCKAKEDTIDHQEHKEHKELFLRNIFISVNSNYET